MAQQQDRTKQDEVTEKKIIIDEDWKAQVQADKEQAPHADQTAAKPPKQPLPPATISFLFTTLATQALIALGALPHPASNKVEKDLDQAKLFIDTLGILEEKTKGNLTSDEKRQLEAILFDLRMQFVEAGRAAAAE
jgi:Domain of unknown function (DUF1844)